MIEKPSHGYLRNTHLYGRTLYFLRFYRAVRQNSGENPLYP